MGGEGDGEDVIPDADIEYAQRPFDAQVQPKGLVLLGEVDLGDKGRAVALDDDPPPTPKAMNIIEGNFGPLPGRTVAQKVQRRIGHGFSSLPERAQMWMRDRQSISIRGLLVNQWAMRTELELLPAPPVH
ncbi:MAG: hypothetical protein HZY76_09530 [Anaerolineae bacterium]|nr:MAG: hypothetical protein HZY76_09530 [Anaerolineae bacterium]